MERAVWTDERLDDLASRMDAGFQRVDTDMRELRQELSDMRHTLLQVGGGMIATMLVGFLSVLAAILTTS
jgi:hypothetical protein